MIMWKKTNMIQTMMITEIGVNNGDDDDDDDDDDGGGDDGDDEEGEGEKDDPER